MRKQNMLVIGAVVIIVAAVAGLAYYKYNKASKNKSIVKWADKPGEVIEQCIGGFKFTVTQNTAKKILDKNGRGTVCTNTL